MIRVDIETIVMAAGPIPSVVVLRERKGSDEIDDSQLRALSIRTGAYEAAAIGHGVDPSKQTSRPLAYDVMYKSITELGAKVERIEINRWDDPVFYTDVILTKPAASAEAASEADSSASSEIRIDARPSDAIALAMRANAPMYVEDDVMNRAGSLSRGAAKQSNADELEKFDAFVQTLSPDDF